MEKSLQENGLSKLEKTQRYMKKNLNKFISILVFLFFVVLFSTNAEAAEPRLNSIIIDAKVLTYEQLSQAEKGKISQYCCFQAGKSGWVDATQIEAENGYFVKTKINRKPLAYWTFLYDCGSSLKKKKCSEKEHTAKVKKAIQDNNPYGLYGKYRSAWRFYNGKKMIPSTDKFNGHDLLTDKRDKKKQIDELLIGPLPQKPTGMTIELSNSLTDKDKSITIPIYKVK
ncbi:MAG: hypothetical protein AB1489_39445 [Acidobacteriota bacterium]